jgi:catalase
LPGQTTIQHTLAPFVPELSFGSFDSGAVTTSYGVTTSGKYTLLSAVADVATLASGGDGFVSNFAYEISKHRCYERETDGLTSKVAY